MRRMSLATGLLLGWAFACGGGKPGPPPAPQTISVAISPPGASLWTGGTQTFTGTVSGTTNTAITWSVVEAAGGSISTAGLYTAPGAAGSFHVKATMSRIQRSRPRSP